MSLPGTVTASSNPFVITVNPNDGLIPPGMEETSVLTEQHIEFTVKEDTGTGGGPPFGPSNGDGEDGGETPAPEFDFTPKSVTVTADKPHGLTVSDDGRIFTGKYAAALFGSASIVWLDINQQPHEVEKWDDVPDKEDPNFYAILSFNDTPVRRTTITYDVTAIIEQNDAGTITEIELQQSFSQVVTYDWTAGRDALRSYAQE